LVDLNTKTTAELVKMHNEQAATSARIEGQWKKSKDELIRRIQAIVADDHIGDDAPAMPKAVGTENPDATSGTTVKGLAEAFLTATDGSRNCDLPGDRRADKDGHAWFQAHAEVERFRLK
jgi:hypothetical protein